ADEDVGGDAFYEVAVYHAAVGVEQEGPIETAGAGVGVDRLGALLNVDAKEGKARGFVLGVDSLHARHLIFAVGAPGGPEVDPDGPAPESGEADDLAGLGVFEVEVGGEGAYTGGGGAGSGGIVTD